MMIWTLFRREWRVNYKIVMIFCGIFTLYTGVIISMFDPEMGGKLAAHDGKYARTVFCFWDGCAGQHTVGVFGQLPLWIFANLPAAGDDSFPFQSADGPIYR